MPILLPRINMNLKLKYEGRISGCESKWAIYHSTCSPYEWDQIGIKIFCTLKVRKRRFMLTDLKVPSLVCKCVFYISENVKGTASN